MKKYLLSLTLYALAVVLAMGQGKTISGTVSDKTGPLPGASIVEKGQPTNGAMTDIEGRFKLVLKGNSQTVVVSMIGYLTKEVSFASKASVAIELKEDAAALEEVVVVGYGTQKRANVTGAVAQISGAEIRQNPSASVQNTLMGRLPGFTSQQRSGQPGSDAATFNIRGANSYTGTVNPLVIVDDMEYPFALSELDADQIESITILKDAATTAIYGLKGADGVVLITTRRGKAGKPQISFRTETGFQSPTVPFDFLNSYQVATLRNQALANDGKPARYSQEDLDHFKNGTDPYGHPDVNWAETILRDYSIQTRNNLNISGGTEKAKYFVSVGHLFQNGIMKDFSTKASDFNSNYYYQRYNFRSNIDIKATKNLSLGLDLSGYFGEQNNPWLRGTANNPFYELYDYMRLPPMGYPVYNPDGSFGGNNSGELARLAYNMVGRMTHLGYRRNYETGIWTNVTVKQDLASITKGLSARAVFGYNVANNFTRNMERDAFPSFVYNSSDGSYSLFDPATERLPIMKLAYSTGPMNRRITFQANLSYDRTFNQTHHVYALALSNMYTRTPGAGLPENFRGYTFRVGYDYKGRYLAEVNAGYNGSDKFVTQERYTLFPAASIGWNIAEEPFFKDKIGGISLLKIRASHGLVGKDPQTDKYIFEQVYNEVAGVYSFGEVASSTGNNASGVREGELENLNVRWELEQSSNIGLDIDAFNGKLKASADFFRRYRYDILRVRQSIPAYAGVAFPIANYASIKTRGFEVDVTHRHNIGEFSYSVNANVSVARSIIVEADEAVPEMAYQAQTGGYLGRVLGYVSDGFYTAENIDSSPKPSGKAVGPGDLRYKDLDGDGVITPKDRTRLDYPNLPNTIYGLNLGVAYKGFSMSANFQAATNFTLRAISTQIVPFVSNLRQIHLDTWTPENPNASLPRILPNWIGTVNDPNTYVSDFWNRRGDYLRLRTAEFAYALPSHIVTRLHLQGIRVYANGSNLFTWMLVDKNIYNLDPESASGSGIATYPQQKIWNFGLHLTF